MEGPFGDHTGYYTLPEPYPQFHIERILARKDAIYPSTIVGIPPMEDFYMGTASVRIFLPVFKMTFNEIVDIALPAEGTFHNLVVVSIKKQFPYHAMKVMHGLWGMGQMMFTKIILIFDREVDVQDMGQVIWRLGNNVDPRRDTVFVDGPVDALDHASPLPHYGSKMGIDCTRKWPEEGFTRDWPEVIEMDPEVKKKIDDLWPQLGLD